MKFDRVPVLAALVAVVVAVPVVVLLVAVGLPVFVDVPLALVLAAAAVAWWWRAARGSAMRGLDLRPAGPTEQPRVHNVLDGLCDSHGFRRPAVFTVTTEARNAAVFGRTPHEGALVLTTGLLATLDRMELEGLLARQLAALDQHGRPAATAVVPLLRVLPGALGSALARRVTGKPVNAWTDADGVRLTRYPPGLAAALDRIGEGSTEVAGVDRASAHLWVVTPTAAAPLAGVDDFSLHDRIDALREL